MAGITVIKLTGESHKDVDFVCEQIKAVCDQDSVDLRGPIPLPTRRLVVPCRKTPCGEGNETYDHWEMRIHKRLLEMKISSSKDENALRKVARVSIPDTVSIELSMRNVN
ncbi:MAG: 30S ribosomal protein S10 [Euryarchaeota archaeon]|jgi:small subunit ribosomal protein S10|nr:30S ribosomal protein S10 [Euryarchaeota archaeon]MBT3972090.1 30S ribosomal protein S10 [Euryarchaeota archaeon]MBT4407563.1 30S ribosomal protein S10 [Euryarchaeota archaeon]MBT6645389.1 30S ribosomal protein S10 [Euryarchaeota archaeon]